MKTTSPVTVLIVDDEKNACTNLQHMLLTYVDPGMNIAGTACNTQEAERMITDLSPDAIFLDIEMPKENAFKFLERISPVNFEVIFVTSYDEYAIKAFKLNAIDYILKPISISELTNAVARLKERLSYKNAATNISYTEIAEQVTDKRSPQNIALRNVNSTEIVDFEHILYIEAQGSYSRIVFMKNNSMREVVMSNPLSEYEELLPEDIFFRTHRSYLVNHLYINKILKDSNYKVQLKNETELPVSRRRYSLLVDHLKNSMHYHEPMD